MATDLAPDAGPERRLAWRDPAVLALLAGALLLLLLSLARQRGYPLADAVEYMDRAQAWVAGEELGETESVRSFAFSAFFVPPFLLARALGVEDPRPVVWVARALQVALALGLVLACARLGQRVAGRSAGLAAGWMCAAHPVVLQYGVQPVSAIATSLCVALGLERLIVRGSRRDSFVGGLWFGLAFLMAYQSLLIALAVLAALVVRDRWAHRSTWVLLALGLATAMAAQLLLDRAVYDTWRGSLYRYVLENVGYVIVHFLVDLGQVEAAGELYGRISALRGDAFVRDESVTRATMRFGTWWYLANAPRFLVAPVLAIFVAGLVRALARPRWASSLALVALALALFVMSKKGDKSLRLLLPLLPLCVPLLALGWQVLARAPWSRTLARAALVAAVPLAFLALASARPRAHSAYWDAAAWVDEHAAPAGGGEAAESGSAAGGGARVRMASAYDWAVFLRAGPGVERVKLAHSLDAWHKLAPDARARVEAQLDRVDRLIVHQPLLAQPELVEALAPRFAVDAAFYDPDEDPELGAVLVLARADRGGRRLVATSREAPAPRWTHPVRFREGPDDPGLELVGFDLEDVPGAGWWWITYHWRIDRPPAAAASSLEVRDRITAPDESRTWQNDHVLGRGARLAEDARFLSEGFLFVPSAVEPGPEPRFRPLGGAYRRGELLPLRLWIEVRATEGGAVLDAFRAGVDAPLQDAFADPHWRWSAAGNRVSKDGLVQAGGFLLPVHPRAFSRDDGKPLAD